MNDLISGLNRLTVFIDIDSSDDFDQLNFMPLKGEDFQTLPVAVKSQLRKALGFYLEYGRNNSFSHKQLKLKI